MVLNCDFYAKIQRREECARAKKYNKKIKNNKKKKEGERGFSVARLVVWFPLAFHR